MECDSMHSTIERRTKNCIINVPEDYVDLFATARIMPRPYRVHHLDHTIFKDYSKLGYCTSIRPGTGTGDPVVTDLVALCYQPDGTIQHKLSFDEEWAGHPCHLDELVGEQLPPRQMILQFSVNCIVEVCQSKRRNLFICSNSSL